MCKIYKIPSGCPGVGARPFVASQEEDVVACLSLFVADEGPGPGGPQKASIETSSINSIDYHNLLLGIS